MDVDMDIGHGHGCEARSKKKEKRKGTKLNKKKARTNLYQGQYSIPLQGNTYLLIS